MTILNFNKTLFMRICIFLILIFSFVGVFQSTTYAADQKPDNKELREKRVVIISLPRTPWNVLQQADTPNLDALISRGSIANLSVRVFGGLSTPAKSYATLSAGNRSTAVDSSQASFLAPDETLDNEQADQIFKKQRGSIKYDNPAALGIGFQLTLDANKKTLNQSKVGSFAQALTNNQKSIAVFGNADSCIDEESSCYERSVAYVGSDTNGVVRYGDVSTDILKQEHGSSFPEIDFGTLTDRVKSSIANHDVTLAECSDLERLDSQARKTKESVATKEFNKALKKCDAFVGSVAKSLDFNKDQIYVVSPNYPAANEQTTVFIAAGKSIPRGYASSSTTRIKGIVSLVDIAPSVLKQLDVKVPEAMNPSVLDWRTDSASNTQRIDSLENMNDLSIARENTLKPTIWFFAIIFIAMVLLSITAFTRESKIRNVAEYISYVVMTIPTLTFLLQPFMISLNRSSKFIVTIGILSFIFGAVAMFIAKKIGIINVVLSLTSIYLIVQFVDIVFDGRLQFNSIFGNATIVAGRFVGFNNQSFALLASAAIIFVAMVKQKTISTTGKKLDKVNVLLIVFLLLVLVVDGAPQMGSDVGGVLAFTPTIFVIVYMLYDKKVSLKAALLAAAGTAATIIAFTLVDLARPAQKRTHLGRFAESLFSGDGGLTIERKLVASIKSFTRPEMTIYVLFGIVFILFIYFYKDGIYQSILSKYPASKFIFAPSIFLAVIGALLNDSGVTIPSLMFFYILPIICVLGIDAQEKKITQ